MIPKDNITSIDIWEDGTARLTFNHSLPELGYVWDNETIYTPEGKQLEILERCIGLMRTTIIITTATLLLLVLTLVVVVPAAVALITTTFHNRIGAFDPTKTAMMVH